MTHDSNLILNMNLKMAHPSRTIQFVIQLKCKTGLYNLILMWLKVQQGEVY